jgi:hypothetical protein
LRWHHRKKTKRKEKKREGKGKERRDIDTWAGYFKRRGGAWPSTSKKDKEERRKRERRDNETVV